MADSDTTSSRPQQEAHDLEDLTYTDVHGAQMTIPAEQVALYSTIKGNQLAVLNRIIADKAGGFEVRLDQNAMYALSGLAEELAHACKVCIDALSQSVAASKGGAS